MAIDAEKLSAAESLRKTRTFGKVRCHNPSCMERMEPSPGAAHIKCATCGMEYPDLLGETGSAADSRTSLGSQPENRGRSTEQKIKNLQPNARNSGKGGG